MSDKGIEKKILYFLILNLLLVLYILIFGMINSYFDFVFFIGFESTFWGPTSTFLGALLGAGISGWVAVRAAKVQVNKQQEIFSKELEIREKEQEDDKKQKLKKLHSDQLLVLQKVELELIRIIQETIKVQYQAEHIVFNGHNYYVQTVSKIKKTNDIYWNNIDLIVDIELKLELHLLKDQYDEMVDILAIETLQYEDQRDLVKIQISKLKQKEKRGSLFPEESIHLMQLQLELMNIETDYNYFKSEKETMWLKAKNGQFISSANSIRLKVRKVIVESSDLCGIKASVDPATVVEL